MIYDRAATILERHAPQQLVDDLHRAPLFHFPLEWKSWVEEHQDGLRKMKQPAELSLHLPFLEMAVEDEESLVLIKSRFHDLENPENIIMITDIKPYENFSDVQQSKFDFDIKSSILMIQGMAGQVKFRPDPQLGIPDTSFRQVPVALRVINKQKGTITYKNVEGDKVGSKMLEPDIHTALKTSIEQLWLLTQPYVWVVSREADESFRNVKVRAPGERTKLGEGKTRHKIPRTSQRSIYMMITNRERVKMFPGSNDQGTSTSPAPHPRRGHWRKLFEPRQSDGKEHIWVNPCWVGPEEVDYRGSRYKVHLDL